MEQKEYRTPNNSNEFYALMLNGGIPDTPDQMPEQVILTNHLIPGLVRFLENPETLPTQKALSVTFSPPSLFIATYLKGKPLEKIHSPFNFNLPYSEQAETKEVDWPHFLSKRVISTMSRKPEPHAVTKLHFIPTTGDLKDAFKVLIDHTLAPQSCRLYGVRYDKKVFFSLQSKQGLAKNLLPNSLETIRRFNMIGYKYLDLMVDDLKGKNKLKPSQLKDIAEAFNIFGLSLYSAELNKNLEADKLTIFKV